MHEGSAFIFNAVSIYLFKAINGNTRTTCEICWKLTKKTRDNIVGFGVISLIILVSLLLTIIVQLVGLGQEGSCLRVGEGRKEGSGNKSFKKGGQAGSRGGCPKKVLGDWNPLTNYDYEQVNASWELFLCAFLL